MNSGSTKTSSSKRSTTRMSEKDVQRTLTDALRSMQYRVAHFRPGKTTKGWRTPVEYDGAGFPDLVAARRGKPVLFFELKGTKGVLSSNQKAWEQALWMTGAIHWIITPNNLDDCIEFVKELTYGREHSGNDD